MCYLGRNKGGIWWDFLWCSQPDGRNVQHAYLDLEEDHLLFASKAVLTLTLN